MTAKKHQCRQGGTLVGADDWLPTDPRDYQPGGLVAFIGCNALVCDACQSPVRSALGFSQAPALGTLVATEDWTSLPEHAGGASRLYACRCMVQIVSTPTPLQLPAGAYDFEEPLPWRCGGHPTLSPPGELDGIEIGGDDWPRVAARVLGFPHRLHPYVDPLPGFQAHRLHAMLAEEDARAALSAAIASAVTDGVLRRAVALFFAGHPLAEGIEPFARFIAAHPAQVAGAPVNWGPTPTLGGYLADAFATHLTVSPSDPSAPAVRDALRALATHPPGLGATLVRLARVDASFVQDHLTELLLADRFGWRNTLRLTRPEHPAAVVDAGMALVKRNIATRDEVLLALRDATRPDVVSDVARIWPPEPT